jgi:hypothetical protein
MGVITASRNLGLYYYNGAILFLLNFHYVLSSRPMQRLVYAGPNPVFRTNADLDRPFLEKKDNDFCSCPLLTRNPDRAFLVKKTFITVCFDKPPSSNRHVEIKK